MAPGDHQRALYATGNGFSMILDISSPQTPVICASNTPPARHEKFGLRYGAEAGDDKLVMGDFDNAED